MNHVGGAEAADDATAPASEPADRPIRVLYIGGLGRSGSTLLDRMLGQVPGIFSGGEIRDLWQRGLIENRLCGCGAPFRDCALWQDVGREAFGGWDRVDPHAVVALDRAVDRALRRRRHASAAPAIRRYREVLFRLYRAIHTTSGAEIIVDSSKVASVAEILHGAPGVDLEVVHLLRDPRGVAHSWTKRVVRPDVVARTEYMYRFAPSQVAVRWVLRNRRFEAMARRGIPTLAVRYEDLVRSPRSQIERVLTWVGRPDDRNRLDFVSASQVHLQPNHTVMGNPIRLHQGPMDLEVDEAWRTSMAWPRRVLVNALTLPWRARFGYGRRGAPQPLTPPSG